MSYLIILIVNIIKI